MIEAGPSRAGRLAGLQFEIVSSLFVVMLAGAMIVVAVMGSLTIQTVERRAVQELRATAGHWKRLLVVGGVRVTDLSAIARTAGPEHELGEWSVHGTNGRTLGPGPLGTREGFATLLERARRSGEVIERSGFPIGEIVYVTRVVAKDRQVFLVGRLGPDALGARLGPLAQAGGIVLGLTALVFVAFGAYLLRGRIVRRVQHLSAAARTLAAGDLSARIEVEGSDELADLAQNFNSMAESLARERDALVRATQSLARSERLATVGQLAAGVAHEVGNPVSAILGYAELTLRSESLDDRSRQAAGHIRDEALRVRGLVRELLDLARSDELHFADCAPGLLLERARQRMRPQKLLEDMELNIAQGSPGAAVHTDARRVEQVLVNLIENAAQALAGHEDARIELDIVPAYLRTGASRRKSDPPGARFSEERRADAAALRVTDNGPGIPSNDIARIFDPFFTTKQPGEGTGLGLWNGHRWAELLGGRLEIESVPGRTCFSLILPLADTRVIDARAQGTDH